MSQTADHNRAWHSFPVIKREKSILFNVFSRWMRWKLNVKFRSVHCIRCMCSFNVLKITTLNIKRLIIHVLSYRISYSDDLQIYTYWNHFSDIDFKASQIRLKIRRIYFGSIYAYHPGFWCNSGAKHRGDIIINLAYSKIPKNLDTQKIILLLS